MSGLNSVAAELRRVAILTASEPSKAAEVTRAGIHKRECADVRRAQEGGGVARATLLDGMKRDLIVGCGGLSLYLDGMADCLQIAAARDTHVNKSVFAVVLRSVVEQAATMAWLLDGTIDASVRARRYLIWVFEDFDAQVYLHSSFAPRADAKTPGLLEEKREILIGWADAAKFGWKRGKTGALHLVAPGEVRLPSINERITAMAPGADWLYTILSTAAHGERHGFSLDLAPDDTRGTQDIRVSGYGLPPSSALLAAIHCVQQSALPFLAWAGIDWSSMTRAIGKLTITAMRMGVEEGLS